MSRLAQIQAFGARHVGVSRDEALRYFESIAAVNEKDAAAGAPIARAIVQQSRHVLDRIRRTGTVTAPDAALVRGDLRRQTSKSGDAKAERIAAERAAGAREERARIIAIVGKGIAAGWHAHRAAATSAIAAGTPAEKFNPSAAPRSAAPTQSRTRAAWEPTPAGERMSDSRRSYLRNLAGLS